MCMLLYGIEGKDSADIHKQEIEMLIKGEKNSCMHIDTLSRVFV